MFERYTATNQCWLEQEVKKLGVSMGYDIPVHAFKTDKTKMSKGNHICGLEPLIRGGRLLFSNMIPGLDLLFKQFTIFTGIPHPKRNDDGPDMLVVSPHGYADDGPRDGAASRPASQHEPAIHDQPGE